MVSLVEFNQHLLFIVIVITIIIGWSLYETLNFKEIKTKTNRKMVNSKTLELVWTSIPAITLLILAIPSFTLLYAMEEAVAPDMTIKIIGHQWFWCYEFDDFLQLKTCEIVTLKKKLRFTAYLLAVEGVPGKCSEGYFRLLETTKKVLLPVKALLRLLITSVDVLHSWSVPAFGIKMDACPGRLNQITVLIEKIGSYYGACYEICGIQHGFMPVSVVAVLKENMLKTFST